MSCTRNIYNQILKLIYKILSKYYLYQTMCTGLTKLLHNLRIHHYQESKTSHNPGDRTP